jgi:hypothetical protein
MSDIAVGPTTTAIITAAELELSQPGLLATAPLSASSPTRAATAVLDPAILPGSKAALPLAASVLSQARTAARTDSVERDLTAMDTPATISTTALYPADQSVLLVEGLSSVRSLDTELATPDAFSPEDLRTLLPCPQLQNSEEELEQFLGGAEHSEHELHRLLRDFESARCAVLGSQASLAAMQQSVRDLSDRTWQLREDAIRNNARCGDGVRLQANESFLTATYDYESHLALKQKLQEARIFLFQDAARVR